MKFTMGLLAAVVAISVMPATASKAEEITFTINNEYNRDIQIEFYSQNRRHAWPGGNKAYNLSRGDSNDYKLACRQGEKVCYGAWVKGAASTYWGVGLNGKYQCDACCQVCGDGNLSKTLN